MEIEEKNKDLWDENKFRRFSQSSKNLLLILGYAILMIISIILIVLM